MKDILAKPQPSKEEFIFAMIVVIAVTVGVGYIDAVIFDTFVKPDMQGVDNWYAVGVPYWGVLSGIIVWVGIGLGVFRVVLGKLAGAKTDAMLFFTGGLWVVSTLIFYNTGFIDFLYYKLRGLTIPSNMDWLNNIGLFQWTRNFTGSENVEPADLYLTMGLGVLILVSLWLLIIHHYKKGTLRKLGLV